MRRYRWIRTVAIFVIMSGLLDARPSAGQTTPPASAAALAKVEVTLTRLQGETRLSSVPYVLSVGMDNFMARLRIGVDVPTGGQSTRTTEGVTRSEPEYRNIGTSIDAQLAPLPQEGQYQLYISIVETSIHSPTPDEASSARPTWPLAFRSYSASNRLVLKNGEMVEFSVGTDKVSGETIRASVRLTVAK